MSRTNGTYSMPAGPFAPAVANTKLFASDWEVVRADVETALSQTVELVSGEARLWLSGVIQGEITVSADTMRVIKANGDGAADLELNPEPAGSSAATVGLFRTTSTTGSRWLRVYRGDNTATIDHQLQTGTSPTSYINGNGGNLGVGRTNPSYTLDLGGTGAMRVPSGSTAQRPAGNAGAIRNNTSLNRLEAYHGGGWNSIPLPTTATYDSDKGALTDPATGFIYQFGIATGSANPLEVTFPTTFPTKCFEVVCTAISGAECRIVTLDSAPTETGFSLRRWTLAGNVSIVDVCWAAVGR